MDTNPVNNEESKKRADSKQFLDMVVNGEITDPDAVQSIAATAWELSMINPQYTRKKRRQKKSSPPSTGLEL